MRLGLGETIPSPQWLVMNSAGADEIPMSDKLAQQVAAGTVIQTILPGDVAGGAATGAVATPWYKKPAVLVAGGASLLALVGLIAVARR